MIEVYRLKSEVKVKLPLILARTQADVPSSGDDYIDHKLDLNKLIKHLEAAFLLRVEGDSMVNVGINSGDILV